MEKVLCFSRFLLEDTYGWFEGISFNEDYIHLIMNMDYYIFVGRERAEKDKHYKQIIPYVIFINDEGDIFNYKRGKSSGEDRLKNLRSIGIGGHINKIDFIQNNNEDFYNLGLYREVSEEFGLLNCEMDGKTVLKKDCLKSKPVAFINEEDTEVGKVHFGSVHILRINESLIQSLEKDVIIDARFSSYDKIKKEIDFYENWSQLCLNNWSKLEE